MPWIAVKYLLMYHGFSNNVWMCEQLKEHVVTTPSGSDIQHIYVGM